jgi:exodeoxyribonuclease VII large subunit
LLIFVRNAFKKMKMAEREIVGLKQLQEKLKEAVERAVPGRFWVRAETGEVKIHSAGHCYMDLIEKEPNGRVVAKLQAIIWASAFRVIKPYFETSTGRTLERGITVLVKVMVQYSPLYGLSLVVNDIDPSYTIGEQEMKRQQTIARLREEQMFGLNATLPFPPLPRRIAVVSSEGAAGYRDFIKELHDNEPGFVFQTTLFSAPMQGDSAPSGIVEALDKVVDSDGKFDLVVIVRGGGAAQDLVCFDDYELAINIAQFPIPVITGIGHDHDVHIADMMAHSSLKTPTAAASFLIDLFSAEEQQLFSISRRVVLAIQSRLERECAMIERIRERVVRALSTRYREEEHKLELLEKRVSSASPLSVMERGYSIVLHEGRRVMSAKELKAGIQIKVLMNSGNLHCQILMIED